MESIQFHTKNTSNRSLKLAKDQIRSVQDLRDSFGMKSNLS